jgi:hypothetical protein
MSQGMAGELGLEPRAFGFGVRCYSPPGVVVCNWTAADHEGQAAAASLYLFKRIHT